MFLFIGYLQLLSNGVHIGHNMKSFEFLGSWFLFAIRAGAAMINLYKTTIMLKYGFTSIAGAVNLKGPIWFINMDPSTDIYFFWAALYCGEFYLTSSWVNGMISNYSSIFNFFFYQEYLGLLTFKESKYSTIIKYWHLTRFTWPRALFVSSIFSSLYPLKEAISLQIPSIGIADTNSQSQGAGIPIPGNDDSSTCLIFFNTLFSSFISQHKFSSVSAWFFNVRRSVRPVSFFDWIKSSYFNYKFPKFFDLVNFYPNLGSIFSKSLNVYFSSDFWKSTLIKKFILLDPSVDSFDLQSTFSSFIDEKDILTYVQNGRLVRHLWRSNFYFHKKIFKPHTFNSEFIIDRFFPLNFFKRQFFQYSLKNWELKFNSPLKFIFRNFFINLVTKYFIFNFKTMRFLRRVLKKTFLVSYVRSFFNNNNNYENDITLQSLLNKDFNVDYDLKLKMSSYRYLKNLSSFYSLKKKRSLFKIFSKNFKNFNYRVHNKYNHYPKFSKIRGNNHFRTFFLNLEDYRRSPNLEPLSIVGSYFTWSNPNWKFQKFTKPRIVRNPKFIKNSKKFYYFRKLNKLKNLKKKQTSQNWNYNHKFSKTANISTVAKIFNRYPNNFKKINLSDVKNKFDVNKFAKLNKNVKKLIGSNLKLHLYGKSLWIFRNNSSYKKSLGVTRHFIQDKTDSNIFFKNFLKISHNSALRTFYDDLKYVKEYFANKTLFDRLLPIIIKAYYPRKRVINSNDIILRPTGVIASYVYYYSNPYIFQNFRNIINSNLKRITNHNSVKLTKSDIFSNFYLKSFKYIDLSRQYVNFYEHKSKHSSVTNFKFEKKNYFLYKNNQLDFNYYRNLWFKTIYMRTFYRSFKNKYIFKLTSYGISSKFFIHRMYFYSSLPNFIWQWQKHIYNFDFLRSIRFLHNFQVDRFYMKTLFLIYWSFNIKNVTNIFSMYLLEIVLSVNRWF